MSEIKIDTLTPQQIARHENVVGRLEAVLEKGYEPPIRPETRDAAQLVDESSRLRLKRAGKRENQAREEASYESRTVPRLVKELGARYASKVRGWERVRDTKVKDRMNGYTKAVEDYLKAPENKSVLDAEIARAQQTAEIIRRIASRIAKDQSKGTSTEIFPPQYEVAERIYDQTARAIAGYASEDPYIVHIVPIPGSLRRKAGAMFTRSVQPFTPQSATETLWNELLQGGPNLVGNTIETNLISIGLGKPSKI